MDPNKGLGENIRTNNWTEKGSLGVTEPIWDGLPPSDNSHRWKRLRSRRVVLAPRRLVPPSTTDDGPAVDRRRKSKNTQSRIVSWGGGNFSLIAYSGEQVITCGAGPPSLDSIPCRDERRVVANGRASVNWNTRPRIGSKPSAHSALPSPNSNAAE